MLIGTVGFIGGGKGAVADILVESYGFKKESFASTVKDATAAVFGWPRELLEGDTEFSRKWREVRDPEWSEALDYPDFSPRIALQLMGTEAGRNVFGSNLWTHATLKRCKNENHPHFVLADTRFKNEIAAIRKAGGLIVRVTRGDDPEWYKEAVHYCASTPRDLYGNALPKLKKAPSIPDDLHQSEWDWIGTEFDFVIYNDGTLADLKSNVDVMMSDINKRKELHNEVV
jgi:hypothetical protein